ncbi:MAG: HAD family hydrolase [Bacteroidetes bacterium]|nr:HAD family hydrolase [Bacteroidota bacterium]
MKKVKIISFDIGNTLIQLSHDGFCAEFINKTGLSKEVLYPLFFEHFLTKNYSLHDAVHKVCSIIGFKNPQKLIDEFQPSPVFLFDDTMYVLESLSKKGILLVAISNCTPWESGGIDSVGLNRYLQKVFYSFDIGAAKPDPAIFQFVQKTLGVLPQNFLHVGDSLLADIEGALSVGWKAVFLNRGNNVKDSEIGKYKVPIIKNLSELIYMIDQEIV